MTSVECVDQAEQLVQRAEAALEKLQGPADKQEASVLLEQVASLEQQFSSTAAQYMHHEALLSFLKGVTSATDLPPALPEAELLSACAVTAAPAPGVAALMTSALDAASELGQTATGTRAALADISAALQAHKASLTASKGSSPGPVVVQTPDGESHSLTSPSQAQAVLEAASAAAQAAAADATAAKEACAAGAQEEAALEAEIAELEARAAALRRAAEERAASEASPSQQALSVQAWYKDTAATLAQFTGVEVTSVSAQVGGQCLAALQLAGLPGVSLEVQYTPLSDPGAGAGETAQAPRVALHDITVQGSVGVPPAEVEAARAEALRCGDLQVLLTALRGGGAA